MTYEHSTFVPYAVDISQNFAVIVGYVGLRPTVYLVYFNSCVTNSFQMCMTVADTFMYNSSDNSTNAMSVKINHVGQVLWGISSMNKVILLGVNYSTLHLISTIVIRVKAVTWMGNNKAAVLVLSQVLLYQITINNNFIQLSTFPNSWKTLCSTISSNFVTIVSNDKIGLAILDVNGSVYVIRPTTIGYYPVTNTGCGHGINFAYSNEKKCLPGTYHMETSTNPCALCPPGTYNGGDMYIACAPCNASSFCPLGSVANVDGTAMNNIVQALAYPQSPENTLFDDILLQNMFQLSFQKHCLLVSPLFWTILLLGFALLLLVMMGALKFFHRCKNIRETIKFVFKQTDLIGEGEMWIGGVVSFSIVVLVSFAYMFSNLYLKQYPIESVGDSTFSCSPNLRNSKFSTQMQLLGIPLSDDIQPIFNMLDAQPYILNVDFVNTLFTCHDLIIQQTVGTVVLVISPQTCTVTNESVISVSVLLPLHTITIQLLLNGLLTVGGIRVGLSGPSASNEEYTVQQLGFMQSYTVLNRTLSQSATLLLQFIRMINATEPLSDGEKTVFSALWIPTFSYVSDQLFLTEAQYVGNTRNNTLLTLQLSEKAYYVINTQAPIAKQSEVIFHAILFTVVCLELFGLVFLIFKLVLLPFFKFMVAKIEAKLHHRVAHMDDTKKSYLESPEL
ncbi:unnamed protein product [Didymodactylos carnosus]|uniref:Transmembrane protein n=1 Tax=Didymodactylos carnosus TaxID=1234261 RepID=A0A814W3G1_9BILA|nr:unnamed protein product [Didymodactylos carnosus]CAF1198753.1 unnamed protein product [Didymodactylos carnosus]CAF3963364.1 unnamed protein product [Didymodactylos carnosus]CAF3986499.1 unnamed protein product [Didymodactylos carnosus]